MSMCCSRTLWENTLSGLRPCYAFGASELQTLLSRFRSYVDGQTKGKDPNKVRIVIEW